MSYGFDQFIKISEISSLEEDGYSFLENNKLIFGLYISIFNVDNSKCLIFIIN